MILDYRTPELTVECLRTLEPEVRALGRVEVLVVDNDSGREAVEHIARAIEREGWSAWAWLLPLPTNGGYAAGNNAGIRHALGREATLEYVHLLNPDTRVRPGALSALLELMDARPEVGIAGSQLLDPDGTAHPSGFRFHSMPAELERGVRLGVLSRLLRRWIVAPAPCSAPRRVDWVSGASMMVRRAVFERVGLIDEGFFLYFEETDFCRRAAAAGYETWHAPASLVEHIAGAATGVTGGGRTAKRAPDYLFQSRRRYWTRAHGQVRATLADFILVAGLTSWQVRRRLQSRPACDPPGYLQDLLRHALHLPAGRPTPGGARPREPERDENPRTRLGLLGLLLEDLATHDRRLAEPGFWALAVHRLGHARAGLPAPLRTALAPVQRLARRAVSQLTEIELAPSARIGRRVRLWGPGPIGVVAREVGDGVQIRPRAQVGLFHQGGEPRLPALEDRVEVGPGAAIVGDVRVGCGSVVGANAVVVTDVPPGVVVGGAPALPVG